MSQIIKNGSGSGSASSFVTDSGTATPNGSGVINITGAGGIVVSGSTNHIVITNSGQSLTNTTVTLTNSQLKNIGTVAIQIVPAQGAGSIILPLSLCCKLEYGGTNPFTNSPNLFLNYGSSIGSNQIVEIFAGVGFNEATSNAYATSTSMNDSGSVAANCENTGVFFSTNASFTGNAANDNTMKISVLWYALTLG